MVATADDRREVLQDHIVVLRGATWADFQRMQEIRGDQGGPRLAYSQGMLEIMSPSSPHEGIKSFIGRLLEAYCLEAGIEFNPAGSWTLEDKALDRGVEPDECYVFGSRPLKEAVRPDLAIEVIWTSGGLQKLDIYAALGVREVWIWKQGKLVPWVLTDKGFEQRASSAVLPGLDLELLCSFLDRPTASAAIRGFRDALRSRRP